MKIDEVDVKYACFRMGVSIDRFLKACRESQLDREYKETSAEVDRLIDEQAAIAGKVDTPGHRSRFLAISDAIDRLWKKQDANMAERYPDQAHATRKEPTP